MLNFEKLRTPAGDGETLLEPSADTWEQLIDHNVRSATHDIELAGRPIDEVRRATRTALGAPPGDVRIVMTGHQPAFAHPGVWAKHVAVRALTGQAGMHGLDLAVDNDAPASTSLPLPVIGDDGLLRLEEVSWPAAVAGSAYEHRPPVDDAGIDAIRGQVEAAAGEAFGDSVMPDYLGGLAAASRARDVVDQHLAGRRPVDTSLAADLPEHRVSEVVGGPFIADVLLEAGRFAEAYNASLAEYRTDQHVRSPDRPLPDLARDGDRTETALWIYVPRRRRRRLWVARQGDRVVCYADRERVGELGTAELSRDADAALAGLEPWVVRPRALTLTLWARLLACDLFVHGIGGAKYDRITDGVLRRYYRCEPPAYVCVSATLRLPLPRQPVTASDLAAARRRERDWRFNPDRYLDHAPSDLLEERRALIAESRCLRASRGPRNRRREVFKGIRLVNARLTASAPEVGRVLTEQRRDLERAAASNRIADGREYFYALQTRARLESLASRLRDDVRG